MGFAKKIRNEKQFKKHSLLADMIGPVSQLQYTRLACREAHLKGISIKTKAQEKIEQEARVIVQSLQPSEWLPHNDEVDTLFELADDAKNVGDYGTANNIFTYLFHLCVINRMEGLFLDYEYDEERDQGKPDLESWMSDESTQECIQYEQYHALPVIKSERGGYLCIPAPMLSLYAFRLALSTTRYFMLRREHGRVQAENANYNPGEILSEISAFEAKPWVFYYDDYYAELFENCVFN